MIAHIRNGAVIKRYSEEKGWVTLEDGRMMSPPQVGYVDGNDKIVPVVDEVQDTSTTGNTVKTVGAWEVQADRVYRLTTIRDKTQAELDAEAQANLDVAEENLDITPEFRALATAVFELVNDVRGLKGQQPVTAQQFKTYLRSKM